MEPMGLGKPGVSLRIAPKECLNGRDVSVQERGASHQSGISPTFPQLWGNEGLSVVNEGREILEFVQRQ